MITSKTSAIISGSRADVGSSNNIILVPCIERNSYTLLHRTIHSAFVPDRGSLRAPDIASPVFQHHPDSPRDFIGPNVKFCKIVR